MDGCERLVLSKLGDFASKLVNSAALRIYDDPAWLPETPRKDSLAVALQTVRDRTSGPYAGVFHKLTKTIGKEYAMTLSRAKLISILDFVDVRSTACHSGALGQHNVEELRVVINDAIKLREAPWPSSLEVTERQWDRLCSNTNPSLTWPSSHRPLASFIRPRATKGYQGNIGEIARKLAAVGASF